MRTPDIGHPADLERDSAADFEALIEQALEQLPEPFRSRLDTVAIVVDDEASSETLQRARARGLFGLYEGVPRTVLGASGAPAASKITIFRRPIEAYYPEPTARARAVRDTLFHEIAHHFGISDARLRELNSAARRGGG